MYIVYIYNIGSIIINSYSTKRIYVYTVHLILFCPIVELVPVRIITWALAAPSAGWLFLVATTLPLSQAISRDLYTSNAVCTQRNCINPVFPGVTELAAIDDDVDTISSTCLRVCLRACEYVCRYRL